MIETKDTRRFPNDPRHRPSPDQWKPVHDAAESGRIMRPPETGRRAVQGATRARLPRKNLGNDKASSAMRTFEFEPSREGPRKSPAGTGGVGNRKRPGAISSARGGAAGVRTEPVLAFRTIRVSRSPSGTAVREPVSVCFSAARAEQLDEQAPSFGPDRGPGQRAATAPTALRRRTSSSSSSLKRWRYLRMTATSPCRSTTTAPALTALER